MTRSWDFPPTIPLSLGTVQHHRFYFHVPVRKPALLINAYELFLFIFLPDEDNTDCS